MHLLFNNACKTFAQTYILSKVWCTRAYSLISVIYMHQIVCPLCKPKSNGAWIDLHQCVLKKLENGTCVWKYGINAFIYLYVWIFIHIYIYVGKFKSLPNLNNWCNSISPVQKRHAYLLWDTATQIMLIFAQMLIEKMY